MTLRDALLVQVDAARAIAGAGQLDQRPTQLTVRRRTWSGGRVDVGLRTDDDLVLPQHFTIKVMSAGQAQKIFGTGGAYKPGEIVSVVVTPEFPGCGYTNAELLPDEDKANGVEILYLLSSNGRPSGLDGTYRRLGDWRHRPYRITIFLQRSNRSDEVPLP